MAVLTLASIESKNGPPIATDGLCGGVGSTRLCAFPTSCALVRVIIELLFRILRFRIVTPGTFKRASLNEYGSPNAGPVLEAEALNFGYKRYLH